MLSAILDVFILNYLCSEVVLIVVRINMVQTLKHVYCKLLFVWSGWGIRFLVAKNSF